MIAYVNGEYFEAEEAKLSVFDRGFIYGDAVFDATRTFAGRPFRLDRHLERFTKSLRFIEIDPEPVIPTIEEAVYGRLQDRNRFARCDRPDPARLRLLSPSARLLD